MRTYQPTYRDKRTGEKKKNKRWWLVLKDHLGIDRMFPGLPDKRPTELLGRQIERLVNYRVAGEQPDAQLTQWLEGIPDKLRSKLVKFGILDSRRAAAGKLLGEHLEDFELSLMAKGGSDRNTKQVVSRVTRITDGCKFRTWTDICATKVECFLAELRNKDDGISTKTSNYYLKDMKHFCRWMIQNQRASKSPLEHLRSLKAIETRPRRALEPDEIRRLLEATERAPKRYKMTGHQRAVLYRFNTETALRRGALQSLIVSSFDFDAHTVTVKANLGKVREEKVIPLKKETSLMMREFVKGKMPGVKVFDITNRTSEMLQADLLETAVKDKSGKTIIGAIPFVDDAGRYLVFHSLRHTTGSLLAAENVHPKVIQSIMGHKDINLTMNRYTHIFRGQESEAIDKLPDLALSSREKQQAVATGTDDLSLGLSPPDGQQRTPANTTPASSRDSDKKTGITVHHKGGKQKDIALTA